MQWHSIYNQFATNLVWFYIQHGRDSGKELYNRYIETDLDFQVVPWIKSIKNASLDPIQIFASFNYNNITIEERKKRIIFFENLLNNTGISDDNHLIKEITLTKNQNQLLFFPHVNLSDIISSRKLKHQRDIWEFLELIVSSSKSSQRISTLFNKHEIWEGIDLSILTIFMFWVNSNNYLSLDKNTETLLRKYKVIKSLPKNYTEYSSLCKKNNVDLYRNLTKIAVDEKLLLELSTTEQQALKEYFNITVLEVSSSSKGTKEKKLNINFIPNLYFELFIMVNGIIKKIVCDDTRIIRYHELEITSDNKMNFTYPNFQIVAIKILMSDYLNGLELNKLYYFTKYLKIKNDKVSLKSKKILKLYNDYNINNINITAIVGKNGTGKSTIAELLIMAINNFTYLLQNDPNYALDELRDLFYTIYTNYSLHALNARHYEGEWLNKLFHKNDGYQTPVVIEPYREEGIIDINVLETLIKQRLLASILRKSEDNKDFTTLTKDRIATHIEISIDFDKLKHITDKTNQDILNILNLKENKNIIEYFFPEHTYHETLVKYHSLDNILPSALNIAKLYICHKVKNINKTYHNSKTIDNKYLKELIEDKSHITFKLHQAINYLNYKTTKGKISASELSGNNNSINNTESIKDKARITIKELSDHINNIKERNNIKSIMEVLPPAFFKVDIIINNDIPFSKLSSGEKQEIYATSSIVYHLQNIESVHQGDSDRISYKYVNIILDEIELYFHPDMQRKFIYNLLQAIENKGGFNHIVGLNIIMITHSPFILSDILKDNILYLDEDSSKKDTEKLGDTFAANIHTLLDNSFFMDDGLMGKFAKEKISKIIKELNTLYEKSKDKEKNKINILEEVSIGRREEMKRIIENIGEPFLRRKLSDMYIKVFEPQKTRLEILEDEREKLDRQIKKLKND